MDVTTAPIRDEVTIATKFGLTETFGRDSRPEHVREVVGPDPQLPIEAGWAELHPIARQGVAPPTTVMLVRPAGWVHHLPIVDTHRPVRNDCEHESRR